MADNICVIPYQGVDYALNPRDITVSALRSAKQKYGPEYGAYISFVNLFLNGDADAIAIALHIVLKKAGINKPPEFIEFSPFDIFEAIGKANEEKQNAEQAALESGEAPAEDPTPPSVDATTPAGTET